MQFKILLIDISVDKICYYIIWKGMYCVVVVCMHNTANQHFQNLKNKSMQAASGLTFPISNQADEWPLCWLGLAQ